MILSNLHGGSIFCSCQTADATMLGGTQDILEFFKGFPIPVCLLLFLPFVLLSSPVYGIKEFPVFRLHQYDMHGSKYGKYQPLSDHLWHTTILAFSHRLMRTESRTPHQEQIFCQLCVLDAILFSATRSL